jgi:hypothetical protein
MTKVVQTTLDDEEYRILKEILEKRGLSLKEGLHIAVSQLLKEETKVDAKDPFLVRKPTGRSGRGDLSKAHDRYLYGDRRR